MLTRFGKQLRCLRLENDERLKDMADKLGVTVAYLSAVENGKRAVPDAWISTLEENYGLTDNETADLQKAAYENKKDVRISLENANDAEMGLALSFARRFKSLSDEEVSRLQRILDER
ncbi:MAG: helix-turn-helix domain-containing protein [Agathobacter sp.]